MASTTLTKTRGLSETPFVNNAEVITFNEEVEFPRQSCSSSLFPGESGTFIYLAKLPTSKEARACKVGSQCGRALHGTARNGFYWIGGTVHAFR